MTRNRIYDRAVAIARRNPVDPPDLQVRDVLAAMVVSAFVMALLFWAGLLMAP